MAVMKRTKRRARTDRPPREARKPAPRSALARRPGQDGFLIVGLGASAGGLEALEEFFTRAPTDTGMAFIVVSHQGTEHTSMLPELLRRYTMMPVREATEGARVERNTVCVAPAGKNLEIHGRTLHLVGTVRHARAPMPIDSFFRSLAEDQQQNAVGIVLSGTGSDGTLGLAAIKGHSGLALAQDEASARHPGMPRSAIMSGLVDFVLEPRAMAERLVAYVGGPSLAQAVSVRESAPLLQQIFTLLRERTGSDFSLYKAETSHRRIERRMRIHQVGGLTEYLRILRQDPREVQALFGEMLIGVTSFFRDPPVWNALAKELRRLLDEKHEGARVRIWVSACASGEEAYSVAILVREYMLRRRKALQVQIFATDVDNDAVETARNGVYPLGIAGDVTAERLQRFFTREDGSYRVTRELRDVVVFARHNLLADPPFTKLDLMTCRNLLIYLEPAARRHLVDLFSYILRPRGLLLLGSSEALDDADGRLREVDRRSKLFRRTTLAGAPPQRLPIWTERPTRATTMAVASQRDEREPVTRRLAEGLLLAAYAPSGVVVDGRGEIVHVHGHTGSFLEPAPGRPTQRLVDLARAGLRADLGAALREAAKTKRTVVRRDVSLGRDGRDLNVTIAVRPITEPELIRGFFLVTFEPSKAAPAGRAPVGRRSTDRRRGTSVPLVLELEQTKQRYHQSIEKLQTSNEELQSANEELESTNEELQSANEELETTREETQSLNEELVTLNSELHAKVAELMEAQSDLRSLLNSTGIATIFLDRSLCIKRFTPEARDVVHLIDTDVGRPLGDLATKLADARLIEDAAEVLKSLVMRERQVRASNGTWYLVRVMPHRMLTGEINGVVITFLDTTARKHAEDLLGSARQYFLSVIDALLHPVVVLDENLRVMATNEPFCQAVGLTRRELEEHPFAEIAVGAFNIPPLLEHLARILPTGTVLTGFRVAHTFPQVGHKVLVLSARRLEPAPRALILVSVEDQTSGDGPR